MTIIWLLFITSVIVLPTTALLALRWALRNGEFRNLKKSALLIFDEDEPVGQMTDFFPTNHSKSSLVDGHKPVTPIGPTSPLMEREAPPEITHRRDRKTGIVV